MGVSASVPKQVVLAASSTYASVRASSMSVNNTWYQVIASTSSAIYIVAVQAMVIVSTSSPSSAYTYEIGTGGAGAEITVFSANLPLSSTALTYPIRVPAGTRVACRTTNGASADMSFLYVPESSVV